VALSLALVWLSAGAVAAYLAVVEARWGLAIGSLAALVYGIVWLRAAARSRLLAWHELVAPWRRG
jgi:hypothetical protein